MSRTKDQAAAVLPTLLSALRLPSISRNWKHLTDTADRDGWPAANLLACLLEIEMAERASRRIQRHREQSGLPAGKTFATFDFDFPSGIRKPHLLSLLGWTAPNGIAMCQNEFVDSSIEGDRPRKRLSELVSTRQRAFSNCMA
ncbi:ATP-binding protein [Mesorhizobium sp. M0933]|uniref:ATP-binding protein n=1 Tax=Mesorhizobium sp. M0933 TaxID=2957030 RepID=UPI00333B82D3